MHGYNIPDDPWDGCTDKEWIYGEDRNWNLVLVMQGDWVWSHKLYYEPYGTYTTEDAPQGSGEECESLAYTFQGRPKEAYTGLFYFRNRWYHPGLGRFMQRDPNGYADQMNLQSFVGDKPVRVLDPLGRETVEAKVTYTVFLVYGKADQYGKPAGLGLSSCEVFMSARLKGWGKSPGPDEYGYWRFDDAHPDPDRRVCGARKEVKGGDFAEHYVMAKEGVETPAADATIGDVDPQRCVQCIQWNWEVRMIREVQGPSAGVAVGIPTPIPGVKIPVKWDWRPFEAGEEVDNPVLKVRICADGKTWVSVAGAIEGCTPWKSSWWSWINPGTYHYRYCAKTSVGCPRNPWTGRPTGP